MRRTAISHTAWIDVRASRSNMTPRRDVLPCILLQGANIKILFNVLCSRRKQVFALPLVSCVRVCFSAQGRTARAALSAWARRRPSRTPLLDLSHSPQVVIPQCCTGWVQRGSDNTTPSPIGQPPYECAEAGPMSGGPWRAAAVPPAPGTQSPKRCSPA